MQERMVLVHYHFFKNAGSTIEWILHKLYGDRFTTLHEPDENGRIDAAEIAEFVRKTPQYLALSSHHFRHPRPVAEGVCFIDICFLRHPLDRLQSMYSHYQRVDPASEAKAALAQQLRLPDFLRWMLAHEAYNASNSQTALLANGGEYYFPPTANDLGRAKETVEQIRFLGVVDQFDESLVVAEFFLRPCFGALDFSYLAQNVSVPGPRDLRVRLEQLETECGQPLFGELVEQNAHDIALWQFARAELQRRLSHVYNAPERAERLRARSQQLATATPAAREETDHEPTTVDPGDGA